MATRSWSGNLVGFLPVAAVLFFGVLRALLCGFHSPCLSIGINAALLLRTQHSIAACRRTSLCGTGDASNEPAADKVPADAPDRTFDATRRMMETQSTVAMLRVVPSKFDDCWTFRRVRIIAALIPYRLRLAAVDRNASRSHTWRGSVLRRGCQAIRKWNPGNS